MQRIVSPEEWNDMIQSYEGNKIFLRGQGDGLIPGHLNSYMRAYEDENRAWATLLIKNKRHEDTYKCPLCEDPNLEDLYTLSACQQMGKYVRPKIHMLDDIYKRLLPDGPNFRFYHTSFERQIIKIWSYDVNSAYPFAMLQDWPDTTKPLGDGYLEEDEIGFNKKWLWEGNNKNERLVAYFEKGVYCRYRFKKMPCPIKDWILKYYELKKNATTKSDKAKYKAYLVVLAGQLRNWNPFVRATFLTRSMNYVKSFFDENTVYANIDCIYSIAPRTDLPFGNELGMFKEEIQGEEFIYDGAIHGTNSDPRWQGIPRSWLKGKNFIQLVLSGDTPPNQNKFRLDMRTGRIEENV